jgi:hypothetical protein
MLKMPRKRTTRGLSISFLTAATLILAAGGPLSAQTIEDRITALEAKIHELQSELAAVRQAATPVATVQDVAARSANPLFGASIQPAVLTQAPVRLASAAAASAAPAPPAAAAPPLQDSLSGELEGLNFFKGVTFGGFIDAYYNWDVNEPDDATVTLGGAGLKRNFDFSHNSLTLSQVDFEMARAVSDTAPLGYMVQLVAGPTADLVNGGDFSTGNSTAAHFMQYYMSGRLGGVTLDFGKFVTPHGAEVIDNRANWNYSRGLLFALAIPYHHFGLRAAIPISDKASMTAFLVNGWNNVVDNNKGKTFGLNLTLNPTDKVSFIQNYMVGQEQAGASDVRHLFDSILTLKPNDKITFLVNYDFGMDRVAGDHVHWQGIAAYLRLQPSAMFALTPRFEFYSDPMGFSTGTRQQVKEFTLTPEFVISENLITRFEYRHDWSNEPTFTVSDPSDDPTKQDTVAAGLILKF